MRFFNEDKSKELNFSDIDFSKGKLIIDTITHHIKGQEGIKEEGHYETIEEGVGFSTVKWVVDKKGQEKIEEHDEVEPIQIFVPFTPEELEKINIQDSIQKATQYLKDTDYTVIKMLEYKLIGKKDENKYLSIFAEREKARNILRKYVDVEPTKEQKSIKEGGDTNGNNSDN